MSEEQVHEERIINLSIFLSNQPGRLFTYDEVATALGVDRDTAAYCMGVLAGRESRFAMRDRRVFVALNERTKEYVIWATR